MKKYIYNEYIYILKYNLYIYIYLSFMDYAYTISALGTYFILGICDFLEG